jgi:hypothetical protein
MQTLKTSDSSPFNIPNFSCFVIYVTYGYVNNDALLNNSVNKPVRVNYVGQGHQLCGFEPDSPVSSIKAWCPVEC